MITEDGAENISDFVPMDMEDIEALMAEPGLLKRYPSPLAGPPEPPGE